MKQPHRHRLAASGFQVEVEHLGLHFAGRRGQRRQQRRALAGDNVRQFQRTDADLRQILVEPARQRRIEIDNGARRIDREEAGRRVVEIIDSVLQFLEHVLLTLTLARHVGDRPDRHPGITFARSEWPHAHAQPAALLARLAGDPHFLDQSPAFARRLEQAVDRFRYIGVADEDLLDRPHVITVGGADQVEIGGVGIKHPAALVGDQHAVETIVDDGLEQRMSAILARIAQNAGGQRKQGENPDRAERCQHPEDVGLSVFARHVHRADGGGDQRHGDQQHHADRARARRALALVERLTALLFAAVGRRFICRLLACQILSCHDS